MKILIYDPDYISHSMDVFRKFLVPELSARVDQLIWMTPRLRHSEFRTWLFIDQRVALLDVDYSRTHPMRWLSAFTRRVSKFLHVDRLVFTFLVNQWFKGQRLNAVARTRKVDIIFCLAFMDQVLPSSDLPVSGILCDLSTELSKVSLANIDKWVNKATTVFCISEFTKTQIVLRYGQQIIRDLKVVPLCPKKIFSKSIAINTQSDQDLSVSSHSVDRPIRCFIPASVMERKGHRILLEAALSAVAQGAQLALTFVGPGTELLLGESKPSSSYLSGLRSLLRTFQTQGGFWEALGLVDEQHYSALLDKTDVVVFPSLYEGFGLPVSEAVMAGLPVIASDLLPIREQLDLFECHHRVILVPPGNPQALAAAIKAFSIGNGPPRIGPEQLARNFKQWTWSKAAESIINHLTSTLGL